MGYVACNSYMSPAAYLAADAGSPVWVDGPDPADMEFAEFDLRTRRRIARTILGGYIHAPAVMSKLALCRRFGIGERAATKLFARWRRDGFARIGPRTGCAFDLGALRTLAADDVSGLS